MDETSSEALILNISENSPYDSLVAYWNFDADTSTTAFDFSRNNNKGTYTNGASPSPIGKYDNGSHFEIANSEYILVSNSQSLNLSGNMTFSFWINFSNAIANKGILSKIENSIWNYNIYEIATGSIRFTIYDGSNIPGVSTSVGLNDGQWHHIVFTRDVLNNQLIAYTDKSASSPVTDTTSGSITNAGDVFIGRQGVHYFDGYLDEIMIFNKTLSQSEIYAIYENQSGRFLEKDYYNVSFVESIEGIETMNVTTVYEKNLDTNISLSVSYNNGTNQETLPQNITGNNMFSVVGNIVNYTLNFLFYSNENLSYSPILNSYSISINPFSLLNSPEQNSSFNFGTFQNFSCSARYLSTISNLSVYSDYNQSWGILDTKVFNRGDKGESSVGEVFLLTNNSAVPNVDVTASSEYVDHYANNTVDNLTGPSYWQPFGSPGTLSVSNPAWITFELNESYAISRVVQDWHSLNFGVNYYKLEISNDNETWNEIVFNSSSTDIDKDDSFDEVNGKYVRITVYNNSGDFYATLYEVYIYGKFIDENSISNNITVDFSRAISNGTYGIDYNWTCVARDENNNEYWASENRTFSINNSHPNVTFFHSYPDNLTGSGVVYSTCNVSDISDSASSLDVEMEYRISDTDSWKEIDGESFNEPYLVYSIGDSIVYWNQWQGYLDSYMNSNLSAVNSSNVSQMFYNFGIGGNTCEDVYGRWNSSIPEDESVIVLCGINGMPSIDLDDLKEDMEEIADNALNRNNTIIWLTIGTATNWTLGEYPQVASKIETMNSWLINNLSVRKNFTVVDTYSRLYNGTAGICKENLCNSDGLHPSHAGMQVIANAIWEEAFHKNVFNSFIANITTSSYDENKIFDFRCRVSDTAYTTDWTYDNDAFLLTTEYSLDEVSSSSSSSGSSLGTVISDYFLEKGYNVFIPKGYDIKFKHNGETHSVKVDEIKGDVVTVVVSSDPQTFDLRVDESVNVDIDLDGVYDLELYLRVIRGNYANVVVTKISESYSNEVLLEEVVGDLKEEGVEDIEEVKKVGFFKRIWNWIKGLFD